MTDADVVAALTDRSVLALTLFGECRNEPIEGIVAVGCVVRNRVRTQYRGDSYRTVCLAPWQFSCWRVEGGKANHEALLVLAHAVVAGTPIKDRAFQECTFVADGLMSDALRNRVGACRHYHTAAMQPRPTWAISKTPAYEIAGHLFYEGIL